MLESLEVYRGIPFRPIPHRIMERIMSKRRLFYRRHLPHQQPAGATLFITFRLAGSLPRVVIDQLQTQRNREDHTLLCFTDHKERRTQASLNARRAFGHWGTALEREQRATLAEASTDRGGSS